MINAIIRNDFRTNKNNLFVMMAIIIFYSLVFLPTQGLAYTIGVNLFISLSILFGVLNTNLNSDWYSFLLTTKVNRKTVVKSLLLFFVYTEIITILFTSAIYLIMKLLVPGFMDSAAYQTDLIQSILIVANSFSYCFFLSESIIALSFKYSVNIARTSIFAIVLITVFTILGIIYVLTKLNIPIEENLIMNSAFITIIVFWVLNFLIYQVIMKIINQKDF